MKTKTITLLMGLMLAGGGLTAQAQQLAFPGAQGWGRFATGGRSGSVYHVTNLNDSGTGSLRDAVSQSGRIVVFDVAGVINISSRMVFASNLYVAGQTAPGEGVTVYGDGVSFSGATNTIVRYMRFRMGHKGTSGKDCAGIANGTTMIFDHCSFAWGLDETFSINPDGKGDLKMITIQNSVIGQGLMTHSAGGLIQADSISLVGNLYCDNATRNNKVKGTNQYANNIVYNWKNAAYIMGGDSEGSSYVNIQSNLFVNGPAVGGAAFTGANADFHCYGEDNWQDANHDGTFAPTEVTDYSASTRVTSPYAYPELQLNPGSTLLETSLPTVGASLPYRDYVDCYMIDEVRTLGTSGALISNEESLVYGAPSTWTVWSGHARVDADKDGMPDAWEKANGTNPAADDAMTVAANGYTNIENYINRLTTSERDFFLRKPMCAEQLSATTTTIKVGWRDYTDNEAGYAVELKKGDAFVEVGRTAANATAYTIAGLEPGATYVVRLRAFADDAYSDYTDELSVASRPVESGVIDIDTYQPDYTYTAQVTKWDLTSAGWNDGTATYQDASKVLFAPTADATVSLDETVSPAAVVCNSEADLTLQGKGAIAGEASVNKAGDGMLVLNTTNRYSGATVLHQGTLAFNSLANGGEESAIGMSAKYAQNWLLDGGTYLYTGGDATTDREMRVSQETELNIAENATTVTMNGNLEGTGNFVLNGAGTLKVNNADFFGSAFTGHTVLKGGNLYLGSADIAKAGIGSSPKLVMAGGELSTAGETNSYETYSFPIEVTEGTVSQLSPYRLCYITSKVSGMGTLQYHIPYLREYISGDWSEFTGQLIANGTNSTDGSLLLLQKGREETFANASVYLKGNARLCGWNTNITGKVGGLSGDAGTYLCGSSKNTKNFSSKWIVGSANSDETFKGIINDWSCSGKGYTGTVAITKTGTGDWRLTGSNTYSGITTVSGGRLIVNGTNSGKGIVNITADATLAGTGTVAGKVTAYQGATVLAGDSVVMGSVLKMTGGFSATSGSMVNFPLYCDASAARCNQIRVTGALAINGAILVLDLSRATSIPDNQEFTLFNTIGLATISGTGFASIEPAQPSATQVWDTSELLTTGKIYVRNAASGIDGVNAGNAGNTGNTGNAGNAGNTGSAWDANAPAYRMDGMANQQHQGIIIQKGKKCLVK